MPPYQVTLVWCAKLFLIKMFSNNIDLKLNDKMKVKSTALIKPSQD